MDWNQAAYLSGMSMHHKQPCRTVASLRVLLISTKANQGYNGNIHLHCACGVEEGEKHAN